MTPLIGFLLVFFFTFLEGWREYTFFKINRAARFVLPHIDIERKRVNVALFLFYLLTLSYIVSPYLILVGLLYRNLFIDEGTNIAKAGSWKNARFFYPSTSKRSITDQILLRISKVVPLYIFKPVLLIIVTFFYFFFT